MGDAGKARFTISTNPWACAATSKSRLYCVGLPVVAVYANVVEAAPKHTAGLRFVTLMVGVGLTVMLIGKAALVHPVAELMIVTVALYVPATMAPGTVMLIGVAGSAVAATSTK